jgi:hypothetical protein
MKLTLGIALNPLDQLIELTRTAEECGFSSIALPDSIFFSQEVAAEYPYASDGRCFWTSEAPAGRGRAHRRGRGSVVAVRTGVDADLRLKKDGLRRLADGIIAVTEGQ